jgi:hypothetical protein
MDFLLAAALAIGGVFALGLVIFGLLALADEAGFRVGRWRARVRLKSEVANEGSAATIILTAIFALLAFLLGMAVNFAQDRFEARREAVLTEANDIGTSWLKAKLAGGADGEALANALAAYAHTRRDFVAAEYTGDVARSNAKLDAIMKRSDDQQAEIWRLTTKLARAAPTPVNAALVNSINDMISASLVTRFDFIAQSPGGLIGMLLLGSMVASGAVGFQLGLINTRETVLTWLLLLVWTGAMVMIVDLNRPRIGSLRVDTRALDWTISGFPAPGPPPNP